MAIFKKLFKEFIKLSLDLLLLIYFLFIKKINNNEFVILTGSDSSHFNSLVNLLKSLMKFEKNSEIKVINLGMNNDEILYLKENFNIKIEEFDFQNNPSFLKERDDFNKLGSYAWKPISIYKEFVGSTKNIIWLDAGCLITRNLNLLKSIVKKNGFYSPQSSDTIIKWTHPQTLKALDTNKKLFTKRNISGGIVGFANNSEKIKDLLGSWYEFSKREDVIAPKGSSRLNHRQDQAILSVLIHKHKVSKFTPRTHKIFGILRHQDNENFKYIK
jgi:hypothetical protein